MGVFFSIFDIPTPTQDSMYQDEKFLGIIFLPSAKKVYGWQWVEAPLPYEKYPLRISPNFMSPYPRDPRNHKMYWPPDGGVIDPILSYIYQ